MTIVPLICLALSPIQIDGSFDDWNAGTTRSEDDHYIYALVTLPSELCLQQLPQQRTLDIGEYTVIFSPTDTGYGVSCSNASKQLSPYDIGLVFAPTTASKKFELRIDKPSSTLPTTSFDTAKKGDVRVVSWNVQFGNLLDDTKRSARILRSLQPDVLLLQELDGDDSPKKVGDFLSKVLGGDWFVHMSKSQGDQRHHQLRCAIATKFSSESVTSKRPLPQKTVMSNIDIGGNTITCISLHLRCCGGPESEQERNRQEQATMIRRAIDDLDTDGVIVAGDWNLVGTNSPLTTVKAKDLAAVQAFQPDGVLTATWSDVNSPFTPGRLDWILLSRDTFEVERAFILETTDLDAKSLKDNDLLPEDTAILSDHLPLVADVRIGTQ